VSRMMDMHVTGSDFGAAAEVDVVVESRASLGPATSMSF
jgi:hypothetical protein